MSSSYMGLRGDKLSTWTKGDVCWPRDLLNDDLRNCRIITVSILFKRVPYYILNYDGVDSGATTRQLRI